MKGLKRVKNKTEDLMIEIQKLKAENAILKNRIADIAKLYGWKGLSHEQS